MPATIIKKCPTREEFERDFATTFKFPADQQEIARQNISEANLSALNGCLSMRRQRSYELLFQTECQRKYYSAGQLPPQNIFNPLAWAEFIKAWKRGDFKSK